MKFLKFDSVYRGLKHEHVTGFSGRDRLLSSWIINEFLSETYARFKSNQRNQKVVESFDAYLTALRNTVETCNFCSKQWATRYFETVSFSRSRTEMPGNGCFRRGRSTWRDVLTSPELQRARQLTSRRLVGNMKWSTGSTEGPMIFLRGAVNGANELNPRLKKKTLSHESLSASSAHSFMFWRKSGLVWGKRCNVCRKLNHWKGSEVCAMQEKIRSVNQDSDCSDWDSDVASVRTLNAFVHGVALKKDKLVYCEMHVRSNPVRLQVDCGATVRLIARKSYRWHQTWTI